MFFNKEVSYDKEVALKYFKRIFQVRKINAKCNEIDTDVSQSVKK